MVTTIIKGARGLGEKAENRTYSSHVRIILGSKALQYYAHTYYLLLFLSTGSRESMEFNYKFISSIGHRIYHNCHTILDFLSMMSDFS